MKQVNAPKCGKTNGAVQITAREPVRVSARKVIAPNLVDMLAPLASVATSWPGHNRSHLRAKIVLANHKGTLLAHADNGIVRIQTVAGVKPLPTSADAIAVSANDLLAACRSFHPNAHVKLLIGTSSATKDPVLRLFERKDSVFTLRAARSDAPIQVITPPVSPNTCVIQRKAFLIALQVQYALGCESFRPEFMRVVLRLSNGAIRSIAGDGARFISIDREGKGIVRIGHPFELQIHKNHVALLQRLLRTIPAEDVHVIESGVNGNVLTMIRIGTYSIELLGNERVTSPDENRFLNRKNTIRIVTRLADWKEPIRAALAAYSDEMKDQNQIAVTNLIVDTDLKRITVKAGEDSRVVKSLPIVHAKTDVGGMKPLAIPVTSVYLDDMVKRGLASEYLQLEFVDDEQPIVVRYTDQSMVIDDHWHMNGDVRQRCGMFFMSLNRRLRQAAVVGSHSRDAAIVRGGF